MDIVEIFGTNLRNYRISANLSQEKLAELAGLHRNYISDIECFRRSISLSNIERLANALHIPAHKLLLEPQNKNAKQ